MKSNIAEPNNKNGQKSAQSASVKGAKIIHCSYCNNIFSAVPRNAVCLKCKRPANKPLFWPLLLLSLACFPAGVATSLFLRKSRPYAASQALLISVVGAIAWGAIYFLLLKK